MPALAITSPSAPSLVTINDDDYLDSALFGTAIFGTSVFGGSTRVEFDIEVDDAPALLTIVN